LWKHRYEIDPEGHDISNESEEYEPAVFIKCKDCSTLHDLSDTVPMKKE
jgi:hypothetical protein